MAVPHFIIGTAGHVDHGKTALITRLTGINTDRLKEEQERELSIELGFAYFDLPDGTRAGIIDVPGHERFVKNMLAGATGMDLVLLVVAADEGVMPQTREHLDIIRLLDVPEGLVVITKSDLVEEEWTELVRDDLAGLVAGTVFEEAPVVVVSSKTGEGFDDLTARLAETATGARRRSPDGPFRLPVDRVFTMRGFGTVVTGTLLRGTMNVDDPVEVLPRGLATRARRLHVHGDEVESCAAGQRLAINLARLAIEDLQRGDVAAAPGSMQPSALLDVRLRLLDRAARALEDRDRVRLHIGSAELLGRVALLEEEELLPGGEALAQIRLEAPTAAARGDRFVVRQYSPMTTIGGGEVIDPGPAKHRRRDRPAVERLRRMMAGGPEQLAVDLIVESAMTPVSTSDLASRLQADKAEAKRLLTHAVEEGQAVSLSGNVAVSAIAFRATRERVREAVAAHHEEQPLSPALPKHALQAELGRPPEALLDAVLGALAEEGELEVTEQGIRRRGFAVRLSPEQERARGRMAAIARSRGFEPPTRGALFSAVGAEEDEAAALLETAAADGLLVEIGEHCYHADTVEEAQRRIVAHAREHGPFTVAEFRDFVGTTRKFAVPLLEYLDRSGFTRRSGDLREPVAREAQ